MSLGERLREMLDPGASAGGSPNGGPPQRPLRHRPRSQAQPVNPMRNYDASEPSRPMPRAQWIGLGLAAALAVALTAGLVFAILTVTRPSSQPATPTSAPVIASSPTSLPSSVASIFQGTPTPASPVALAPTSPPPGQEIGQRLQIVNTGGDGVNLRRDPGQAGEKIKTIAEGTLVDIAGPDRTVDGTVWRNVRDAQGDTGWIAGGFLGQEGSTAIITAPNPGTTAGGTTASGTPAAPAPTVAPRPTSPGVAASSATRGQVGNTNGQGANIRSEPGSGGKVLKTLPDGSNLEVVGPDKEVDGQIWRQVRDSSGVTGWIIRGAVAPAGSVPTPAPAPARPTSAPASGATAAPAAPAAKPTSGSGAPSAPAPPAATSAPAAPKPTTGPTTAPGNLPIIIQPATPRPAAPAPAAPAAATPKPTVQGAIPVETAKPSGGGQP